jgi:probable rRNA maturation factor
VIKNLRVYCSDNKYKVNKIRIHKLLNKLRKELNFCISSLPINFISSDEIITINQKYLKHNYSTDIITFNYSGNKDNLDGEIFISYEDAKGNSIKYKNPLHEEITRLVIHGILHLIGYNDMKAKDFSRMKKLENRLLNKHKFI